MTWLQIAACKRLGQAAGQQYKPVCLIREYFFSIHVMTCRLDWHWGILLQGHHAQQGNEDSAGTTSQAVFVFKRLINYI